MTWQCEIDTLEGLETFAADEIAERIGGRARLVAESPGTLEVTLEGSLAELLTLHTALAAYVVLRFDVPRPKALLGHQHFERIAASIDAVRAVYPHSAFASMRLSAAGDDSSVLSRLKDELAARTGLAVAEDEGDLLLRLRRAQTGWQMLVRISPRPLATRPWRVCNLPGALNATLAHAMMMLTEPDPADRVLNLACGSGTLMAERLALGRARTITGCDTDEAALRCAQQNLAAAGYARDARLEPWDATHLPLPDSSADVICADLPFGQLVGSHRENIRIYPLILAEATRVAAPGARMVLLTHEVRLLERAAAHLTAHWDAVAVLPVRAGGMTPRVFAFLRR